MTQTLRGRPYPAARHAIGSEDWAGVVMVPGEGVVWRCAHRHNSIESATGCAQQGRALVARQRKDGGKP